MKITMARGLGLALGLGLGMTVLVGGCGGGSDAEPAPAGESSVKSSVKTPAKGTAESAAQDAGVVLATLTNQTVEIGCGMCIYSMPDVNACLTAAVVDGTPMLMEGAEFNAHANGLCSDSAHAVVSGSVKGDKFVATSIEVTEDVGGG